jgi:hypothetical protein
MAEIKSSSREIVNVWISFFSEIGHEI